MRALTEFETLFPDIAHEYYDISYIEQDYVKALKNINKDDKRKGKKNGR